MSPPGPVEPAESQRAPRGGGITGLPFLLRAIRFDRAQRSKRCVPIVASQELDMLQDIPSFEALGSSSPVDAFRLSRGVWASLKSWNNSTRRRS